MTGDISRRDRIKQIAQKAFELLGTGRQIAPFSSADPAFGLTDAYRVAAEVRALRQARGETPIGRKIGFTNRSVWSSRAISGPMWNPIYDRTTMALPGASASFRLAGLAEPRIEPEIVLHLGTAPRTGMSDAELMACVDWCAHGVEIVHSIFPGWSFTVADAVVAYGLHGALLVGPRQDTTAQPLHWAQALTEFSVELECGAEGIRRSGHARNVLGGPLQALRFLVDTLTEQGEGVAIVPGEIITTGTLTEAMPVAQGQTWTTRFDGVELIGLEVAFT
jgi:2-oxo-3-hexenedioate decarboxylase